MTISGAVARPLLAGIFIYSGIDAFRDPESQAKAAGDVPHKIAELLGLKKTDDITLVRVNGAVQALAGSMLAVGKCRRISALVLAASLIPTTYAGHRYWDELDEERRAQQHIQFQKNAAILGGLILAAGDTGGRASVPWQARRAGRRVVEATMAAGATAAELAAHQANFPNQALKAGKKAARRAAKKADVVRAATRALPLP